MTTTKDTNTTDCSRADDGVPLCTGLDCRHFDGKRCELLGHQPGAICEPEVAADLVRLGEANTKLDSTKDIIKAVRAVQASQASLPGAYTFLVVEDMGLFHVWRSAGCYAFRDLLEVEAHALAHLLNLQLPETTE